MEPFLLTSTPAGSALVLAPAGRLDGRAQDPLLRAWEAAPAGAVVLDLSGLTALDGAGLSLLLWLGLRGRREGRPVVAFGVTPRCRQVLDAHLGGLVSLRATGAEALGAVGAPPADGGGAAERAEVCAAEAWAGPLGRARAAESLGQRLALNVRGRRVRGPREGFGPLWHKVYSQPIPADPAEVARVLREAMPALWPTGNRLVLPPPGVVPGAVGFIELRLPGGVPLTTGVRVLHADERSFTFGTLEGHMAAGWITFTALEADGGALAQVRSLARTGDPLFDVGFTLFGHREQEAFWRGTLAALAARFDTRPAVAARKDCVDPGRRWEAVANVWENAGIRTGLALAAGLASKLLGGGKGR